MTVPERKLSNYDWNERKPVYINVDDLTEVQRHRLMDSKHFCMIPWIHMHGYPDGRAYPCCLGEETHPIGNLKQHTIKEIWNQEDYREMRKNMLEDRPSRQCVRCYEQEDAGFSSMRNNSNRHFGHHIKDVDVTLPDGTHPEFEIRYWDIRFSNICNLKCRSCGSIFSSRWYDDDVKLHGKPFRPRVQYAGKTELDIWEQMQEHIPHLEQIYFAGGEPLIMEEHNRILKMLIETGNTGVRLIYNTNLTELKFKKESVLDLWKQFPQVCVAASLDDMGDRAGIIRSGTVWTEVEQNIRDLKRECPHIDFMISPTLSVMNIWNFCEFHRYMVEQEFIRPGDMNLNILQGPREYRIDILPQDIKLELKIKFEQHLEWLRPLDHLNRAAGGFEAAIQFMMSQDRSDMLPQFWKITSDLDWSRNESILQEVPELERLLKYKPEGLRA
jgi:radical SAM protein with 4Fe4S-binding SPASM domain